MSKMILQAVQYVRRQPKDADPPITVSVSPDNVVMKKDDSKRQTYSFDVRVYNGTEPVPYGTDGSEGFVCGFLNGTRDALIADTLTWGFSVAKDKSYFTYKLALQSGKTATLDISFDVTVTIGGKETVFTQKVHATTVEDGAKGEQGISGCIIRTTEWREGVEYRNDTEITTAGIHYLDIVTVTSGDGATQDSFICKTTHQSSSANRPPSNPALTVSKYWTYMNDMKPIRTAFIMADNTVFRFGQTNRLLLMSVDGEKVQGCLQGVDSKDKYVMWLGGETAEKARFKVSYDGNFFARNGIFAGVVRRDDTIVTPDNFLDYFELTSDGYYSLKWEDVSSSIVFSGEFVKYLDEESDYVYLWMPGIRDDASSTAAERETARKYVGNTILFKNKSQTDFAFTGSTASGKNMSTGNINFSSFGLVKGKMAYMTCEHGKGSNGKEQIGWITEIFDI